MVGCRVLAEYGSGSIDGPVSGLVDVGRWSVKGLTTVPRELAGPVLLNGKKRRIEESGDLFYRSSGHGKSKVSRGQGQYR